MSNFHQGQRWVSETEPELGLGTVMKTEEGRVQMLYPATGEVRVYAEENAPLRRIQFKKGDTIEDHEGNTHTVEDIHEAEGVLTYFGTGWETPETKLSDHIRLQGPMDRLRAGQVDEPAIFKLRQQAVNMVHQWRKSPVRGFMGGRIDLISHQLYIAQEVGNRMAPRVMLSDEVGLGKTIEAGLIIHRQLITGRASRILIIVPESLVHQWFVELLRKFNIWVNIFDEERCLAIEKVQPDTNPFLDDQIILTSINFLADKPERVKQAEEAGWDIMVIDEAHHLNWKEGTPSKEYQLVQSLSRKTEGLLLLTATPEQLGQKSHFSRLQLLDPDRYTDFTNHQSEGTHFTDIAPIANALHQNKKLTSQQKKTLSSLAGLDAQMDSTELLNALLDRHGPGRVIFRNTRAAMTGFPKRKAHLVPLVPDRDIEGWMKNAASEFINDTSENEEPLKYNLNYDPRIAWLGRLLHELGEEKVLLICRSREKTLAIEKAVSRQIPVKASVFHEDLTLVQRDRNAAWFSEDNGARLLICSEIGSEGRNFQFAQHLVLFDLPHNPELLEQRIGRLDRIGQKKTIHIHAPYLKGSPHEVLARWYHEGLNAFENNLVGASQLLEEFGERVIALASDYNECETLTELITETQSQHNAIAMQLEKGRDRLLELNSHRPNESNAIIEAINSADHDESLEEFLLLVFDHFGVHVEDLNNRTYLLHGRNITTDSFPELPDEGLVGTFERNYALGREDVSLLTSDHPMVTGAVDLLLGSEQGNCTFGIWPDLNDKTILLEAIFILETLAPAHLSADRFLPPTPIRILVNHKKEPAVLDLPPINKGLPHKLLDNPKIGRKIIPSMFTSAEEFAEQQSQSLIRDANEVMTTQLEREIDRLRNLRKINDHVRPEEIEIAEDQMENLKKAINKARIRLDAVRLIWKGDPEAIKG